MRTCVCLTLSLFACALLFATGQAEPAASGQWCELSSNGDAWASPLKDWMKASSVALDAKNPRKLIGEPGMGILVNSPKGSAANLVSKEKFGDQEVHVEFLVGKGSNSGVKFLGLYEIQLMDSFGKEKLKASECGGIYPRAELLPRYRYLDEGVPPKVNACMPAGEWQTLDAVFRAPRFENGKKVANARLMKAHLNGKLIHDNVELKTPTGHAWVNPESATGPLLLQGDHGPVAFRQVRVRRLGAGANK